MSMSDIRKDLNMAIDSIKEAKRLMAKGQYTKAINELEDRVDWLVCDARDKLYELDDSKKGIVW